MIATLILAATIRVSAAASLTDALNAVARTYKAAEVVFNFGASSLLARQIEEGAPADVFISADEAQMDRLQRRNLIVPRTRRNVLANTLVIVTAPGAPAIHTPSDLTGVRRLVLADPRIVPAGVYAREYLTRLRLWDRLSHKVIPTENVRAALAVVEAGNADAAIVYKTDSLISRGVRIAFEVPRAEGPKISYPAAVVTDSPAKAAAQKFLDYLQSPAARETFRRYGFLLP